MKEPKYPPHKPIIVTDEDRAWAKRLGEGMVESLNKIRAKSSRGVINYPKGHKK